VDETHERRLKQLGNLVGNTPLLEIELAFDGRPYTVFAKAENYSLTGSIKDRMALHIMRTAHASGAIRPGDAIAEATSGNTGIAFAAIGRALGHPVTIFMPDWMSEERKQLIACYGASTRLVTAEEGGFLGAIEMAEQMARDIPSTFLPRQFSNADNAAAHEATTGPEIWWQLEALGRQPDAFVAGVGTGGTIMGVGSCLKRLHPAVKIHPLEPANSPTLSTGCKVGKHRIQGISDEFIPAIMKLDRLDGILSVDDGDSILMAQKLARQLGLGVGISSGANLLGALLAQEQLGPDAVVVTVFADDNKKYLSTDLMRNEPAKPGFLSPDIELKSFRTFKRTCAVCCDFEECGQCPPEGIQREVDELLAGRAGATTPGCWYQANLKRS
jgi:cysteine synthase A